MNTELRSTVVSAGALSPDGCFYWDGAQWKATISADGAWRWSGAAWVPNRQSPVGSYTPARTLGVCLLLGVCIAVAFFQVFVFDAYERFWLALGDQVVYYTFDLVGLTTFLITAALFLAWFHRAYRNAAALGAEHLQYSSGWAVRWWFVPVACLWMPYLAAVDIWKAGNRVASGITPGQASQPDAAHTLVSVWWAVWLLSLVLANLAAVLVNPDEGPHVVWVVSNAVTATAALLAILVVRSVSSRQEAQWRRDRFARSGQKGTNGRAPGG